MEGKYQKEVSSFYFSFSFYVQAKGSPVFRDNKLQFGGES